MSQAPSMPVFTDALIGDTTHLTTAEFGAYCLLLFVTWRNNGQPLPDDDTRLARVCRMSVAQWRKIRPTLADFFDLTGGTWRQKRLEKEWDYVQERTEKQRERAQRGAAGKWGDQREASATRSERMAAARALGTHTKAEWNAMVDALGCRCVRCGATGKMVKDHIKPVYQGGSDGIDNIQPLCVKCNAEKGPENIDHRPANWLDLLKSRLLEAVHDACHPSPSPESSTESQEETHHSISDRGTDDGHRASVMAHIHLDAPAVVERYHDLRRQHWPNDNRLAAELTLLTEASAYLLGLPLPIVLEVLDHETARVASDPTAKPPRTLKAYCHAMERAARQHRTTGGAHAPAASTRGQRRPAYDPDESRRRTLAGVALAMGGDQRDG